MHCATYPVSVGTTSNTPMYCYNVKSVYTQSPNHDDLLNPDSSSHPSSKAPGNVFTGSFFSERQGNNSSPDMWNSNGMNQPGFGGMVGGASAHQSGSYNNMQPAHNHLDYSPHSVSPVEVNRGLPPMSTFHRNNPPASHTSSATSSENTTGNHSTGRSQTGAALGKALASIYSPDHTSSSENSSTPDRSPSPSPHTGSGPPAYPWHTSAQTSVSPSYQCSPISLSQLEDRLDRLDDVIYVLHNHTLGPIPSLPSDIPSLPSDIPSLPSDIPSLPSDIPSLPSDIPSLPSDIPSLPSDIHSLLNQANHGHIHNTPLPGTHHRHRPTTAHGTAIVRHSPYSVKVFQVVSVLCIKKCVEKGHWPLCVCVPTHCSTSHIRHALDMVYGTWYISTYFTHVISIFYTCHFNIFYTCHFNIFYACHFNIFYTCHFNIFDICHFNIFDMCNFNIHRV
ncbi:transcription factor 12-like isoform X1 [Oncorhynchus kisutch]|uniref:transcription factor 12-like isoform X1 n=1 Tax=Oncorhynchus kisutch TaxID=8019 RepID=UPI0012DC69CF|nr:transcription factor 12-like isoform X1 [Oncorhynchus kisutch]